MRDKKAGKAEKQRSREKQKSKEAGKPKSKNIPKRKKNDKKNCPPSTPVGIRIPALAGDIHVFQQLQLHSLMNAPLKSRHLEKL